MKRIVITIVLVYLALYSGFVAAEGNNFGSTVTLSRGIGARAIGMGGGFVALADDITTVYWNPAGLGQMQLYLYYLGLQYAMVVPDIHSYYGSYAFKIPNAGSFAFSWINYSILDIEGRDEMGEMTQSFNSMENTFIISYGRNSFDLVKGLYLGGNIKIFHQSILEHKAIGFGFDVGAIWQPVLYWDHTLGINIQNIAQQLYWQTDSQHVDKGLINVKLGTALKFLPSKDVIFFNHLITTLDFDFSEYYRLGGHVGAEYWYTKSLGFRSGFSSGFNSRELSMGASYRVEIYEIDYAFIYDFSELGFHQHRFSIFMRFR
ncbi:PorV/PorQ family protein [bacterium]|nr:PorV/PorQ family protein [bacterium]